MTTTPTLREAAQQALEALEQATTIIDGAIYCGHELNEAGIKKRAAITFRITALRAALAEPVAEVRDPHFGGSSYEASMLRELLARIHGDGGHYVAEHGLDKALESADLLVAEWRAAPPAPARQEPPADWSVFTGAEVASGLTYAEALDYLTPARLERGWTAVCVVNKDNITAAPAKGGAA